MNLAIKRDDLEQRSDAWKEWRKGSIGASDVAVLMGISPFKTKLQLWEEKALGKGDEVKSNYAIERGVKYENVALSIYNETHGTNFKPCCFERADLRMHASLDGYDENTRELLEIKVPGAANFELAASGEVPAHYYAQIQAQLFITGANCAKYVLYSPEKNELRCIDVPANELFFNRIEKEVSAFWKSISDFEAPVADLARDYAEIEDVENLSAEWKVIKQEKKAVEAREKALREKILTIAGDQSAKIGEIRVTRSVSKGVLDTDRIESEFNVNLDLFRKEPIVKFRVV